MGELPKPKWPRLVVLTAVFFLLGAFFWNTLMRLGVSASEFLVCIALASFGVFIAWFMDQH